MFITDTIPVRASWRAFAAGAWLKCSVTVNFVPTVFV
jgi:hypothetical protein